VGAAMKRPPSLKKRLGGRRPPSISALPKIKRSSAKTGLSRVLLIEINSPDLLNIHSDGTENAVMQINILEMFTIFGS